MLTYLCSPYSHRDPRVMHDRYLAAARACADMLMRREWTFSPIVHCHEMAMRHGMPTDFGFWRDYNAAMLRKVDRLVVLCLDGWRDSVGVAGELAIWRDICREFARPPVMYAMPTQGTPIYFNQPLVFAGDAA